MTTEVQVTPEVDIETALQIHIHDDIWAQNNIRYWEAYRERNQAFLRSHIEKGESYGCEEGTAGWEPRSGPVDYKAYFDESTRLMSKENKAELAEQYRKPTSYSFYVRPKLQPAPTDDAA
jgi:hypothetical protein